ncbi:hypothetical protein QQG55_47350 [Brugia pahangi]
MTGWMKTKSRSETVCLENCLLTFEENNEIANISYLYMKHENFINGIVESLLLLLNTGILAIDSVCSSFNI